MKKLIAVCCLLAACQYAIPTPAIERAAEICEPYGGLESISGEQMLGSNAVRFTCNDSEVIHYMYRVDRLDPKPEKQ